MWLYSQYYYLLSLCLLYMLLLLRHITLIHSYITTHSPICYLMKAIHKVKGLLLNRKRYLNTHLTAHLHATEINQNLWYKSCCHRETDVRHRIKLILSCPTGLLLYLSSVIFYYSCMIPLILHSYLLKLSTRYLTMANIILITPYLSILIIRKLTNL
jgi:hypothetical protein